MHVCMLGISIGPSRHCLQCSLVQRLTLWCDIRWARNHDCHLALKRTYWLASVLCAVNPTGLRPYEHTQNPHPVVNPMLSLLPMRHTKIDVAVFPRQHEAAAAAAIPRQVPKRGTPFQKP